MLKYRESNLIRPGIIGVVLAVLVMLVGLNPEQLTQWATSVRYQALFPEAGGLVVGNDVTVSGIKVGSVSNIKLHNGDALVTFTVPGRVELGSDSTVHIRTGTLLGERVLTVDSAGARRLKPNTVIPASRTSSPYSLTEAVSDLAANTELTDTESLTRSLDTLALTLDQIAPQLGPTFEALTRMSKSLNGRNQTLGELLKKAGDVTAILSERSEKVNALLLNGNDLLDVLQRRRNAIVALLSNTSVVAQQVKQLVAENEQELAPTLDRLNSVADVLQKNRENLNQILPGSWKFFLTLGETVASGPYYNAYVPNLLLPQIMLQPWLDYMFGFRRGVDAGQPPDNAGPRAEINFPYNGIPQPYERWGQP